MTDRRSQVLECLQAYNARGVLVSLSRLALDCGLHDYRDARRIVGDLREMGRL